VRNSDDTKMELYKYAYRINGIGGRNLQQNCSGPAHQKKEKPEDSLIFWLLQAGWGQLPVFRQNGAL